ITSSFQQQVEDFSSLIRGLRPPEHLLQANPVWTGDEDDPYEFINIKTGDEFDVNEYFTILSHLSMEPGYVLDYIYVYSFDGGGPLLYARTETDLPGQTGPEWDNCRWGWIVYGKVCNDYCCYVDHIQTDGTEEAFFELIVLRLMGCRFYQWNHAHALNDTAIIGDDSSLDEAIALIQQNPYGTPFTEIDENKARNLDLEPEIQFCDDVVKVRVLTFNKYIGFTVRVCEISRDFPHKILDEEAEIIIPYDYGLTP
ncbi:hypothetical protein ACFLXV_03975, partial [Chloroflexota bacterium]